MFTIVNRSKFTKISCAIGDDVCARGNLYKKLSFDTAE